MTITFSVTPGVVVSATTSLDPATINLLATPTITATVSALLQSEMPGYTTGSTTKSGAGAVPITHRYVALTTTAADAWTLANGVAGQKLALYMTAYGGVGTLTPTTCTGFTTIQFTAVGDQVELEYINDTVGWIMTSGSKMVTLEPGYFGGSTTKAGGTLAVPITHRYVAMTTGGAEALTLANGVPGQRLHLTLAVDGGDGTLTPTTKTGFATIIFADVGDQVELEWIGDTVGWILVGYAGLAAPPVIT